MKSICSMLSILGLSLVFQPKVGLYFKKNSNFTLKNSNNTTGTKSMYKEKIYVNVREKQTYQVCFYS